MRILVTNDDGIYAPGLEVLERIAHTLSEDVWVVAPEVEQSGAGHSLTLKHPLRFRQVSEKRFAVSGTPTDCVLSAVSVIVPDKIDLVLSGVNMGANIGEDVTHSGTVSAAMEGTLCDIPSIAFSMPFDMEDVQPVFYWETVEHFAPRIIKSLLEAGFERDTLYNVNIPPCAPTQVQGIKAVPHGKRAIPKKLTRAVDPKGRPYYWLNWADNEIDPRRPGSDMHYIAQRYITITPLCLDMTHYEVLARIKEQVERLGSMT